MLIGTQPYQKHTLHTHTFFEQKIRMPYRLCVTNVTSARVCVCIVCVFNSCVFMAQTSQAHGQKHVFARFKASVHSVTYN